jgi:hypothetical protein
VTYLHTADSVRPLAFRAVVTVFAALIAVTLVPGTAQAQTLRGTYRNDRLYGTHRSDEIYARSGDDRIYPGRGYDYVDCGRGYDVVVDEDWSEDRFVNCERVVRGHRGRGWGGRHDHDWHGDGRGSWGRD